MRDVTARNRGRFRVFGPAAAASNPLQAIYAASMRNAILADLAYAHEHGTDREAKSYWRWPH